MKRWRNWGVALLAIGACGDDGEQTDEEGTSGGIDITATEGMTSGPKLDIAGGTTMTSSGPGTGCDGDANNCSGYLDLLFVIDNSGSMGEEQLNLARNMPLLVQQLENLTD